MQIDELDEQILTMFAWQLRCASLRQVAATLGLKQTQTQNRLRRLQKRELLAAATINAAVPVLTRPLAVWETGELPPDYQRLAWLLEKRAVQTVSRTERVFWATACATRMVGGVGGELRQPLQVQHDLGVAEMFDAWHQQIAKETGQWVGEDAYRSFVAPAGSRNDKVPDAVLVDEQCQVVRVFEYGGRYSWQRLRAFHRFWSDKATCYEIW